MCILLVKSVKFFYVLSYYLIPDGLLVNEGFQRGREQDAKRRGWKWGGGISIFIRPGSLRERGKLDCEMTRPSPLM